MKAQHVKSFSNYNNSLDNEINDYLKDHPGYEIEKIVFYPSREYRDIALVVFNINDPPTYSTARGVIK